tara:strand:- start:83 stop:322 length:240 start_codon:yes stop_codon:yes gene_type:complete
MSHVRNILTRWPRRQDIVDDIGVPYTTVASWIAAGSVPAHRHVDLVESARKRGIALTHEELARAHHLDRFTSLAKEARP